MGEEFQPTDETEKTCYDLSKEDGLQKSNECLCMNHFELNKGAAGVHYFDGFAHQVVFPFMVSLAVIFHESGHAFFSSPLGIINNKLIEMNGIFLNQDFKEPMEVFNDYISMEALSNVSSHALSRWNYKTQTISRYYELFYYVNLFFDKFEYLFKRAMIENKPRLVTEVLGEENFKEYLSLFCDYEYPTEISRKKAKLIIAKMEMHAKSYQANYKDIVEEEIRNLESQGKKVRVLKPSMDKLALDEKIIRATIQDLD